MEKIKSKIGTAALYAVFLFFMIAAVNQKINFHVDEMYSYGLSNNIGSTKIIFADGTKYDAADVFENYLTVGSSERFNYPNVWKNQKNDVHPPLYYAVLHTICSLFPETFSVWFAAGINIAFALFTWFFVQKICQNLTSDKAAQAAVSAAFILSSGILNAVTFLRMYIMAMFWVTAQTYVFLQAVEKKIGGWKFYGCLFLLTVSGALTHYYCIVYAVLISIVFGIWLLIKKEYRQVIAFSVTQGFAGAVSWCMFPPMIVHMFSGYRGKEALSNLNNMEDYWKRLKSFFAFINDQLFGGFLGYILCGLLAGAVLMHLSGLDRLERMPEKCKKTENTSVVKYSLMFVPAIVYYLAVSKMAAYQLDRYVFPIYAVVLTGVLCFLFHAVEKLFGKRGMIAAVSVVLSMTVIGSWQNAKWSYLYKNSMELLRNAEEYSGYDCLCIYDAVWKTQVMYCEALHYNSITFMHESRLEFLENLEIAGEETLVLAVVGLDKKEDYVKKVMEHYPQFTKYRNLGSFSYGTTYVLYGD